MTRFRRTPVGAAAASCTAGAFLALLTAPATAATFNWSTGTFVPGTTAPSPLVAGDVLDIVGAGGKGFSAVGFDNGATVNWQAGSSSLTFDSGASVRNAGLWDAQGDASMVYAGGTAPTFNNSGTLRKSGGTGNTQIGNSSAFNVVNSGTVQAQTGTITFSGNNTFNAGSIFTGAGAVVVNTASAFNGGFQSSNLTLAGGVQTGTAAVLGGQMTWQASVLAGAWAVSSGSTLSLRGAGSKSFDGTGFTNNGTAAWAADSGSIVFASGAAIVNVGLWDAQGNAAMVYGGGAATRFSNSGTLRKSAGSDVTQIGNSAAFDVVNSGTVEAQTGTIAFAGNNTFNGGTVFTGAGSVTVNTASAWAGAIQSSNLSWVGGVQTGAGAVLDGQVAWRAATLAGGWRLGAGSRLALQGGGGKTFDGASFDNEGTVAWEAGSGSVVFASGAVVANAGLWDAQGDASLVYGGGVVTALRNTGTLRKSAGSGVTQIGNSAAFDVVNSGTVDARTGTIAFNGNNTFNAGSVFTGAGSVAVNTASVFRGAFNSSNLTLASGVQTGEGAVMNGQVRWTSGTLAGVWSVAPGATLNVQGAGGKSFTTGTYTNAGTVVWQADAGSLVLSSGASFVNDGTLDARGNSDLVYGGGTATSFVNNGTLKKTGGSDTTSVTNSSALVFVNNGTVDVQVGTIALPANFSNAGTLKGSGTLQTSGSLTNNGTLAPGSFGAGTLALTGGSLTQTAGGTFAVDLTSLAVHDLLTVAGSSTLGGTLALNCLGACSFAVGDALTILDATGTLSGSFAGVTLSGFDSGAFDVVYDLPTASVRLLVTQSVSAVPEPGNWALMAAGLAALGMLVRRRARVAAA